MATCPLLNRSERSRTSSGWMMLRSSSMNAFGKIAAQNLPGIDADGVAVHQVSGVANDRFAHQDWAIGLQNLQLSDFRS